jgi:hypothetical protein
MIMKIVCLTFTCPRDAAKAALCGAFLPKAWARVWCVETAHADMPVPAGVEKLVADFPRGGSLRYAPALDGMAKVFSGFADKCDCLVKLDSDTVLWRPEAWTSAIEHAGTDFVYIRRNFIEGRLFANGNAYSLSRRALERMRNFKASVHAAKNRYDGHEDRVFSAYITTDNVDLVFCQLDKMKCHWRATPYYGADCLCSHYGYISFDQAREKAAKMCKIIECEMPDVSAYVDELKAWEAAR